MERKAEDVIPRAPSAPMRSRLPSILRVPVLICLNMGIRSLLWEFTSNFLAPELGSVSRRPVEDDVMSFYAPATRIGMHLVTVWMTWYFNYDCKENAREKTPVR
jgi:hypothetical protein